MNGFIINNRKKIRLLSHILFIIVLLNMAFKVYTGEFASNLYTNIMLLVIQILCFIVIQIQLSEKE